MNEHLLFLSNDPDGKILLENINKNHPNGFTIKKDSDAASNAHAAAYVSGDNLVIGGGFNPSDKSGTLRLFAHEMTHAATGPNVPTKGTGEAMANVIAARIGYRYSGKFETTNYGHTFTFDGSTEAEAQVYKDTLLDTYKNDSAWPRAGYSYEGTPDFSYGDYLESLGFNFDFPFVINDLGGK